MTCRARQTPDNELHCVTCALRWDVHEERPPGCKHGGAQATVDELREAAVAAAEDAEIEQVRVVAELFWQTLQVNLGALQTPSTPAGWTAGLTLFLARFVNHSARPGHQAALCQEIFDGVRAQLD